MQKNRIKKLRRTFMAAGASLFMVGLGAGLLFLKMYFNVNFAPDQIQDFSKGAYVDLYSLYNILAFKLLPAMGCMMAWAGVSLIKWRRDLRELE